MAVQQGDRLPVIYVNHVYQHGAKFRAGPRSKAGGG
jgi:hypothetical protein